MGMIRGEDGYARPDLPDGWVFRYRTNFTEENFEEWLEEVYDKKEVIFFFFKNPERDEHYETGEYILTYSMSVEPQYGYDENLEYRRGTKTFRVVTFDEDLEPVSVEIYSLNHLVDYLPGMLQIAVGGFDNFYCKITS